MNLIERYLQDEESGHTIINSQSKFINHRTGVHELGRPDANGRYISMDTYISADGVIHNAGIASLDNSGVISTAGLVSIQDSYDRYDTMMSTAVRSNTAAREDLEAIDVRVSTLEANVIAASVAPLRMMEIAPTPMTAVFQGSEYEIILADGSIIRASNFQIREVRDEGSS